MSLVQVTVDYAYVLALTGVVAHYAISLTVVVAVLYLAVVRFMDLNEKEPIWAVSLMFVLGAMVTAILLLLVNPILLGLPGWWEALAEESAKFVAFFLGALALAAVARVRGWPEINDLLDGIVYGTAVGLGAATGEVFIRELLFEGVFGLFGTRPLDILWSTALLGLSDGLFGAIIGAGFGAAVGARSAPGRVGYPLAGLIGAILAHALYVLLAQGHALGGYAGLARTWLALAIPLLVIVAISVLALARERRIIGEELAEESQTGAVTDEELAVLRNFLARRTRYAKTFVKGDFDGWLTMKELHNRQVQLALAKRRATGEPDPERRAEVEAEVGRLRASVLAIKRELEAPPHLTGSEKEDREGA